MNGNPSATEILAAIADWLDAQAKQMAGRDAYFARVAVNALGIVGRELAMSVGGSANANAALCAALRDGTIDENTPGLFNDLTAMARHQIAIDQPHYRSPALLNLGTESSHGHRSGSRDRGES